MCRNWGSKAQGADGLGRAGALGGGQWDAPIGRFAAAGAWAPGVIHGGVDPSGYGSGGKPGKVALVADLMRKLLLQLHAIARRGTPWV